MSAARINKKQRKAAEDHLSDHPQVELGPQELANVTRAIGGDIGGFDFEMDESYYGRPGSITVMGQLVENGRRYEVTLSIVRGYRVTKDML